MRRTKKRVIYGKNAPGPLVNMRQSAKADLVMDDAKVMAILGDDARRSDSSPLKNNQLQKKVVTVKQKAARVSFRALIADELDYAKDMFLMPFVTVREAVVSGLRRNGEEIQKYHGRTAKNGNILNKSGN